MAARLGGEELGPGNCGGPAWGPALDFPAERRRVSHVTSLISVK